MAEHGFVKVERGIVTRKGRYYVRFEKAGKTITEVTDATTVTQARKPHSVIRRCWPSRDSVFYSVLLTANGMPTRPSGVPCLQHAILTNNPASPGSWCCDGLHRDARSESEPGARHAPEPAAEQRELLTIGQLVAYSGLGERTLRGYLHRRVQPLPHYRVAKKILIRRSEFDGWLDRFRRAADGDDVGRVVDEILSGLTGPQPLADTHAHPMRRA